MEVVVDNPVTLVQLGNLSDPLVLLVVHIYSNNSYGKNEYQRKHYYF